MNIDISDLPGNSNMEKAQKKREDRQAKDASMIPVAKGVAQGSVRKRGTLKLSDVFIVQDLSDVLVNLGKNVLVPRLRQLAYEMVDNAARGVFLGEKVEFSASSHRAPRDYNSISRGKVYVNRSESPSTSITTGNGSSAYRFETVEFDDYGKARLVLDSLDDMMEESGVVTIADLYSAAELSCPYTAYYYGWTDISSAKIKFDGDKYWIKFPKVKQIKD